MLGDFNKTHWQILMLFLSVSLRACAEPRAAQPEWREYRNSRTGLALRYPPDYEIRPLLDPEGGLVSAVLRKQGSEILITLKDLADYPAEWREQGRNTFVGAAVEIARMLCDAGGPDGERSCPDVLRQSTFANAHGLECVEIELREEIRSSQPPRFTTRVRGPVYSIRLPRAGPPLLLFLEYDPDHTPSTAERILLAEMARTVSGAKTGGAR